MSEEDYDNMSEAWHQQKYVEWFKKTFPGVVIIMIRNDGYRTGAEKLKQVTMGLHAGASDLHIPEFDYYLEMKKSAKAKVKSKISDEQLKFEKYIKSIGKNHDYGYGFEDAKEKTMRLAIELNKQGDFF